MTSPGPSVKRVANPIYGVNELRIGGIGLDLHTQAPDMHVHGALVAEVIETPHLFQQNAPGKDDAPVLHEIEQQIEFARQEVNLLVCSRDGSRSRPDLEL